VDARKFPSAVVPSLSRKRKSSLGDDPMQDSKFWRVAAVLMIAAVLYVGHGLHNGGGDGMPSLVNTAYAGGVGVSTQQGSILYTSSQDGRTIFHWTTGDGGKPKYLGLSNTEQRQ